MRLNAKILKNVENINSWSYANQAHMQEGQSNTLYLQLVDLDKSISISGEKSLALPDFPIRYISLASSISVFVTFPSIDDDLEFEITGTQQFPLDKSIWKFVLSSSQTPNSGYIRVRVVEDGSARAFSIRHAIIIDMLEVGGC